MISTDKAAVYEAILREELVPAMGCTEPVAIAYAAALAREVLGCEPEIVSVRVSANIIKNVKSVVVPHTGGLRGIEAAVAAGIVAGDAQKKLEVLACVAPEQQPLIAEYQKNADIRVEACDDGHIFDITVELSSKSSRSLVRIADAHTNIIRIEKDDIVKLSRYEIERSELSADRSLLDVGGIVEYAQKAELCRVRDILERQITLNMAIAEEGIKGNYGAGIGRVLLSAYGDNVRIRARAMAAAASDARMNGCELPVVINSGSGNQGITACVPIVVFANELGVPRDQLLRALIISNLVTVHLKTGIGRLSAYCGAVSAGCGSAAAIAYLYGGGFREIAHTLVNSLAIASGIICDGAKASCAAKIAEAVDAGILGFEMFRAGKQFYDGEGIVKKGVENTIENISLLAREGMKQTDREIIRIMLGGDKR